MHSQLRNYMELLSHLHVHATLSLENEPAMCASNGRLNGLQNMEVSKRQSLFPVGDVCTVPMLSTP